MTREYYQILEVSETAPLEEIKKSYRKLAQRWHPDKWNTKSLVEREEANKKMQEINRAYEILSNEDKRKRYDLGESEFTSYSSDTSEWENYFETEKARLNTEAEKIRFQLEAVAYKEVLNKIGFEISINGVYPDSLDSKLWEPYSCWQKKVINLKVVIERGGGIDEVNSELYKFQEEMITAIRKRKEELDNGINDPYLNQERKVAIELIEKELNEKGLEVGDLNKKYQNYREQINSLIEVWEIRALRDEIKRVLRVSEKPRQTSYQVLIKDIKKNRKVWNIEEVIVWKGFFGRTKKELMLIHDLAKKEYDSRGGDLIIDAEKMYKMDEFSLEKRNEIKQILNDYQTVNERKREIANLTREQLIQKIIDLEYEVQKLKSENGSRQEIQNKESMVQEIKTFLNEKESNNNSLTLPIIATVSLFALLVGLVIYKRKRK